ncbi:unnamed protein product [Rotaria magnacalcarata]|uniref:Hermes trasposase DNA-binding domain-containing protein n=1 Tax=Rotaria magnacalcarata TaxID=392030 RepID=A0A814PBQ0_9BILA|nr:unnamed protein product [Rotaria magnacalcarata]
MNQLLKKNDIVALMKQHDESIALRKPKKSQKSSEVWEYFWIIVVNVYRQRVGTTLMAKHKRACYGSSTTSNDCLDNQLKVTEYYASSKCSEIPKRIKEKVKLACTEFTALDCRAFQLVSGEGFLKMAQTIFDAGRCFSHLAQVNVNELIPSPITISRNVDRLYEDKKAELTKLCSTVLSLLRDKRNMKNLIIINHFGRKLIQEIVLVLYR